MTEPRTNLTPQQHLAVATRDVSVVLSSGAGCGKTHVLTSRYLAHLLDDGVEVGEIVAITFTDRAARQMRGRIRQVLTARLKQAAAEDEAEVWRRHLRGLESAPISTIHSFCGTLLRQHAIEAGLDARFEVLEEVLAVNLETEALQNGLQQLLTSQTEAGDDLRQLVLVYGWRPVIEAVQALRRRWDAPRWLRWLELPEDDVIAAWGDQAGRLLPGYIDSLLARRPAIWRCLTLLRQHPPLPGPMTNSVRLIQELLPLLASLPRKGGEELAALVDQLHEAAKVGRAGSKAWPDAEVYEQIKRAFEDFRKELKSLDLQRFVPPEEGLGESVRVGRRLVRVVRSVQNVYAERKRHHGVVDFQDLLALARNLVRENAGVRVRLQERYRFVLLDEAQDTDPVQMELIELLCGARRTEGKLFAVGDVNQSIYRFRGADVHLFQNLRQDMPHQGQLGLTVNFRSQPAILDFANALLGHRLADFEPLSAHHPQVNLEPCVEFLWAPRAERSTVTEARIVEAEWIARRLAAMIGREALVVDRAPAAVANTLRPVRAADVVLLFRSMSNVPLYEAALRDCGLDYYLVGGRAFFAQQEIYDLLNLLRTLENPQDGVSLAGVLRSPFCCLSDETLFVLARHRDGLWAGLNDPALEASLPADQTPAVRRAREHLERWRQQKDRLPIARLLGAVFADSGFDAATQLEYLADRKLANLWKLLDLARTFDRSGLFGLAEFITRLGDLVKNQAQEEQAATQPENADVIRLMSIHQAKGLEFPVVVIPDLAAVGGGSAHPIAEWDDRLGCVPRPPADMDEPPFADFAWKLWQAHNDVEEWHEDLRILYVACTRARDYLILSSAVPEPVVPSSPWLMTLAERFDLLSGRCLVPDIAEERRPRVTVYDRLRLPPEPSSPVSPQGRGADVEGRPPLSPRGRGVGGEGVPSLSDAERALRVFTPSASPADLIPVDALCDWLERRGTLLAEIPLQTESGPAPGVAAEELLLRSLLAGWDFADPHGWRPLLASRSSGEESALVAALEDGLARLAGSDVIAELAANPGLERDVEYLLRLDASVIQGRIDCLWRDESAGWHLLLFVWRAGASEPERVWNEELPRLTLAAAAVQQQTGTWPRDVGLVILPAAELVRRPGRHLPHRRILAEVSAALQDLRR